MDFGHFELDFFGLHPGSSQKSDMFDTLYPSRKWNYMLGICVMKVTFPSSTIESLSLLICIWKLPYIKRFLYDLVGISCSLSIYFIWKSIIRNNRYIGIKPRKKGIKPPNRYRRNMDIHEWTVTRSSNNI